MTDFYKNSNPSMKSEVELIIINSDDEAQESSKSTSSLLFVQASSTDQNIPDTYYNCFTPSAENYIEKENDDEILRKNSITRDIEKLSFEKEIKSKWSKLGREIIKNERVVASSIIVSNLSDKVTETTLYSLFSSIGQIRSVEILPKKEDFAQNSNTAIVEFICGETVKYSIDFMHGIELYGQILNIRTMQEKKSLALCTKMYVRGLGDLTITLEKFREIFETTEQIRNLRRHPQTRTYILFLENHEIAANIIRKYNKREIMGRRMILSLNKGDKPLVIPTTSCNWKNSCFLPNTSLETESSENKKQSPSFKKYSSKKTIRQNFKKYPKRNYIKQIYRSELGTAKMDDPFQTSSSSLSEIRIGEKRKKFEHSEIEESSLLFSSKRYRNNDFNFNY